MATPRERPGEDKFKTLNRVRAMVGLGAYPITDPAINPNPPGGRRGKGKA